MAALSDAFRADPARNRGAAEFSAYQVKKPLLEGRGFGAAARNLCAGVAELVDAPDLGSGAARRGGSSPFTRTIKIR